MPGVRLSGGFAKQVVFNDITNPVSCLGDRPQTMLYRIF